MKVHRFSVLLAVATAIWTSVGSFPSRSYGQQGLLVTARFGNNVLGYAGDTGDPLGQFDMGPGLLVGHCGWQRVDQIRCGPFSRPVL